MRRSRSSCTFHWVCSAGCMAITAATDCSSRLYGDSAPMRRKSVCAYLRRNGPPCAESRGATQCIAESSLIVSSFDASGACSIAPYLITLRQNERHPISICKVRRPGAARCLWYKCHVGSILSCHISRAGDECAVDVQLWPTTVGAHRFRRQSDGVRWLRSIAQRAGARCRGSRAAERFWRGETGCRGFPNWLAANRPGRVETVSVDLRALAERAAPVRLDADARVDCRCILDRPA
jgi:hypothetical protein